mmetsp:Transcript_53476/g.159625  ORF Transcript_53476/g.159625 Transcript_53476/m.159625 type:complete len:211 (+) Transcript_53476:801-1433(+)
MLTRNIRAISITLSTVSTRGILSCSSSRLFLNTWLRRNSIRKDMMDFQCGRGFWILATCNILLYLSYNGCFQYVSCVCALNQYTIPSEMYSKKCAGLGSSLNSLQIHEKSTSVSGSSPKYRMYSSTLGPAFSSAQYKILSTAVFTSVPCLSAIWTSSLVTPKVRQGPGSKNLMSRSSVPSTSVRNWSQMSAMFEFHSNSVKSSATGLFGK